MDTGGDFAKFLMPTVQENATPMGMINGQRKPASSVIIFLILQK